MCDPTAPTPSGTVTGALCRVTDDLYVCRIADLSTFAVPLGLAAPPGGRLETWALAVSPDERRQAISYLLLLRSVGEDPQRFRTGDGFVLATHFRDLRVEIVEDGLILTPHECTVLARSALTVQIGADDGAIRSMAALLAFVTPGLDALMGATDEADALGLGLEGRMLTVTGDYVPHWIVLRANDGYRRFAVEEATLSFDGRPRVALTLEAAWPPALLLNRAILVGRDDHRVGVLRRRRPA